MAYGQPFGGIHIRNGIGFTSACYTLANPVAPCWVVSLFRVEKYFGHDGFGCCQLVGAEPARNGNSVADLKQLRITHVNIIAITIKGIGPA
jgi:hypothetical protein